MRNKNAGRLHTLQTVYHEHPHLHYQKGNKLKELINRKLEQRMATLQDSPRKKLLPLQEKEGKEGKEGRLRAFLQRNEQMIRSWHEEEKKEKGRFKSRLKLAALSPQKSLDKLKRQESKRLKETQKSTLFPSQKNFHLRSGKGSSERLRSVQTQAYRYYLQNLLNLMQENKQQFLQSRRQIKKEMKRYQRQKKEEIITSKRQLVRQIEQQLIEEQTRDHHRKMEQYRRELQAELEQELSQQEQMTVQSKKNIEFKPIVQKQTQKQEKRQISRDNPQQKLSLSRSKSLDELRMMLAIGGSHSLQALNSQQQQRCMKVINRLQISKPHNVA